MNKTTPLSIRLQSELNEQLAVLADAMDRPKSWLIEQAVKDFLAVQAWQLAAIDQGIEEGDKGLVVAHEEVVAWVESWDTPDESPMPVCK